MNKTLSKYLFYYPSVLAKGEAVPLYLNEYKKFQWKSAQEIAGYQLTRLNQLLRYVAKHNTYYGKLFQQMGRPSPQLGSLEELASLPTLSKADLIKHHDDLSSSKGLLAGVKTTGGSTGEPVKLHKSPPALARERAATWRAYEWAGIDIGDPQARFWGVPHSRSGRFKARITDLIANRVRLSAFNITTESLQSYYENLSVFKPAYLYGYVSAVEAFANHIAEHNLPPPASLKSIITTSEVLSAHARSKITDAFQVPVFNEYGCGEVGSIAHECPAGRLHLMADNVIVEIESKNGAAGEIIVTDLFNTATPLIRYRLGDFGTIDPEPCPCGRTLPLLKSVHGRAYDLIRTPTGKSIHPESLIYVFEGLQQKTGSFRQFQAVQVAPDRIVVKLIPVGTLPEELRKAIIDELKANVCTEIDYQIEVCSRLEREASGKMRLVKSELAR